jgi:hypothetical protein
MAQARRETEFVRADEPYAKPGMTPA